MQAFTIPTMSLTNSVIGRSTSPLPFQSKAEQELLLTYINAMHKMNPALLHNFAAAAATASASTTGDKRESTEASARSPPTPPTPAPRPNALQPPIRRMVSNSASEVRD